MEKVLSLSRGEKARLFWDALKKHQGIFLIGGTFFIVGLGALLLGFFVVSGEGSYVLMGMGGIFFIISLLGLSTIYSSTLYYYEKDLLKKYGVHTTGTVVNKRIEDYSHEERPDIDSTRRVHVEEFQYYVEYEYTFDKPYQSEFLLDEKDFFEKIEIGQEIPIQVLKTDPESVHPRLVKLGTSLGLSRKQCH